MNWNWRDEGFLSEPRLMRCPGDLKLFRAWGGASQKTGRPGRAGVCFSTQKPSTRSEAEGLFSAWEWGNSCIWLTEFRVSGGTNLYVGPVHPGDFIDPTLSDPRHGVQIFIQNPITGKVFEAQTTKLEDDLGGMYVLPGSRSTH